MIKRKKINFDTYNLLRILVAVMISFVIACVIILLASEEPIVAIEKLFLGPLQTKRNFFSVISTMIPLVFTGLAINVMHKSGLFSMSADASFYMGAVVAAYIAIEWPLPAGVHQFALIVAAGAVGGLISLLPALIKKFTGANELVVSLMFNYVFFYGGLFVINTWLLDQSTGFASYKFRDTARLGTMVKGTNLHYGFIIMLAVIMIMYIVVERSKFGYQLKVTGSNRKFARYSGIGVTGVVLGSQCIGGVLAGMGGSIELVGIYKKFEWYKPVNYVWDGILVNLLANSKPALVPVAAFFLSYVRVGADIMSRNSDVDNEIVSIVQGVIILLVAAERFLYGVKKRREEREVLETNKEAA